MDRVRTLLATRNGYVPGPSVLKTGATSGVSASSHVPCVDCKGTGRDRRGRVCLVCDGLRTRRRVGDEQPWDLYTNTAIEAPAEGRGMTLQELDESISAIDLVFAEREGRVDHERFGWERARLARDRSGSYRTLDLALERLAEKHSFLARRLSLVYDHELVALPDGWERMAVMWLALAMPRAIRIPEWAKDEELERLTAEALSLHRQGLAVADIAVSLALRKRVVESMVRGSKAA